jgi:hypothetical protein
LRHRRTGGGSGNGVALLVVIVIVAVIGFFLWQKKSRGEISISLGNISQLQADRVITWSEFGAMLNLGNEKGTVVVQAIPVQIDDTRVTIAPPTTTMRNANEGNFHKLLYDKALRQTIETYCNKLNPPLVYFSIRMPDATVVNIKTGP